MTPRRRILILCNPTAGRGGAGLAQAVAMAATLRGAQVEIAAPANADALARLAATAEADAIGISGGDGTVRCAAPALAARQLPFALLPAGTANVMALEARSPRTPAAIAALLCAGAPTPIPWGMANGAPFVLVAGVGLDGAAAAHAAQWKPVLGRAAYWAGIGRAAFARHRLRIVIDGVASAADWALCTAVRRRPRCIGGRLQIVTFSGGPALRPAQLAALAASRLAAAPGVRLVDFTHATIDCAPPAPSQVDGEPLGATPLVLVAQPAPLPLLRTPPAPARR